MVDDNAGASASGSSIQNEDAHFVTLEDKAARKKRNEQAKFEKRIVCQE